MLYCLSYFWYVNYKNKRVFKWSCKPGLDHGCRNILVCRKAAERFWWEKKKKIKIKKKVWIHNKVTEATSKCQISATFLDAERFWFAERFWAAESFWWEEAKSGSTSKCRKSAMLDAERFWAAERFLVTERFWWGKNKSLDPHPNVHVPRITATTVVFGKSAVFFYCFHWNLCSPDKDKSAKVYPECSEIWIHFQLTWNINCMRLGWRHALHMESIQAPISMYPFLSYSVPWYLKIWKYM